MPKTFDSRDYSSCHTSGGDPLAGLRRDRTIDALRWPLIWLAIGATFCLAAYSAGYLYDKVKGASATYRHGDTETSVSINRMAATPVGMPAEPVSTTDNPISGR